LSGKRCSWRPAPIRRAGRGNRRAPAPRVIRRSSLPRSVWSDCAWRTRSAAPRETQWRDSLLADQPQCGLIHAGLSSGSRLFAMAELVADPREALPNVRAPVIPVVGAGILVVLVRHVQRRETRVERPVLIHERILGANVEIERGHQIWLGGLQPRDACERIARSPCRRVLA